MKAQSEMIVLFLGKAKILENYLYGRYSVGNYEKPIENTLFVLWRFNVGCLWHGAFKFID